MNNWSDEETDDPVYADRRNFYKVEKWSRDGLRGFAGLINVLPSRREDDPARTASAPNEAVFFALVMAAKCGPESTPDAKRTTPKQ